MQRFPILMYHQVDQLSHPKEPMRGMVVSPDMFAAHMGLIKRLGFKGLSMRELLPYLQGKRHTRQKLVGITFDDGYLNNLTQAMPVLDAHGFTATCYMVSALIGKTNAWDHPPGVPGKPLMNVAQARQWVTHGHDVGSHTRHHLDLSACDGESLTDELAGSRAELRLALGSDCAEHFCYPYGRYNPAALRAVQAAGYLSATTTQRARVTTASALHELPRVLVSRTTGRLMLAAKLLTRYEDRRRDRA